MNKNDERAQRKDAMKDVMKDAMNSAIEARCLTGLVYSKYNRFIGGFQT